jgi:hypothetical protein
MDIDEGDGTTILDNALVHWTQESGQTTHESIDSPVITAGGAAGRLRTGQYIDYRNRSVEIGEPYQGTPVVLHPGLLHQQYLGNVLQAMGLSPGEYDLGGGGGYPELFIGEGRDPYYPNPVLDARGDWLPWLQA